jgi:hypothetical protein
MPSSKAVISLSTGMQDPEKVTVALLVAVGAAEQHRPTLMFLTKEAVRLVVDGVAWGVACEGCPLLPELTKRYEGGRWPLSGLPDLLQRPAPGRRHAGGQRQPWRHRPRLGVDRRRAGHHLQLLM